MRKIGIGIIGAGDWAGTHADHYRRFPDLGELMAFADPDRGRAEKSATTWGVKTFFADYRELLARDDISLVSVCAPPSIHAEISLAALRAGKHVLCEKPLAASLSECDAMIAEAEQRGLVLAGVFQNRFFRSALQAKALLDSGELGRPLHACLAGLWWRGPEYYAVPWRGTWERECGGTLLNHHSHLLDVALHLLGDAEVVHAEMATLAQKIDVEDAAAVVMRMRSGALLTLLASSADHHGEDCRIELAAEKAGLTLELYGRSPLVVRVSRSASAGGYPEPDRDAEGAIMEKAGRLVPAPRFEALETVIRNVLMAARGEEKPLVSGREARRVVEHIFAVYQAASTGVPVNLPLVPGSPFYTREGVLKNVKRGGKLPR